MEVNTVEDVIPTTKETTAMVCITRLKTLINNKMTENNSAKLTGKKYTPKPLEVRKDSEKIETQVGCTNRCGKYVEAIPLPFCAVRYKCVCGKKFWTSKRYREHYALAHILDLR